MLRSQSCSKLAGRRTVESQHHTCAVLLCCLGTHRAGTTIVYLAANIDNHVTGVAMPAGCDLAVQGTIAAESVYETCKKFTAGAHGKTRATMSEKGKKNINSTIQRLCERYVVSKIFLGV